MNKKITILTLSALLYALCVAAQAQQPKKIPRIGYQSASSSGENNEEAFRQGLRELDTSKGRTSSLNGDLRRESSLRSDEMQLS
jgi:hypothetical protein